MLQPSEWAGAARICAYYRPRLDEMFGVFGEDRRVVRQRLAEQRSVGAVRQGAGDGVANTSPAKGPRGAEKYFWKNSVAAYRWMKREAAQPDPAKA